MKDYSSEYFEQKHRVEILEAILAQKMTEKEIRCGEHLYHVQKKNETLKRQIRDMQLKAEKFNILIYSTGLIVNCTGCWAGRPFEPENLTEEKVKEVEIIAYRLREWWTNHRRKIENDKI